MLAKIVLPIFVAISVNMGFQYTEDTKITIHKESVNEVHKLMEISDEDNTYTNKVVKLTEYNRDLVERLVMSESGGEDYIGACLVAQTIKDTMVYEDNYDLMYIKSKYKYSGGIKKTPTQEVKDAVDYIFNQGGIAVRHKLMFYYAPKRCTSEFHERQEFIVEYGGHRFFYLN